MESYRPKPKDEIFRNMSAIRSEGNRTEVALRKALFHIGMRYRVYAKDLPGKPDIVFIGAQVVVFVDGDYWHGRLFRERGADGVRERIKSTNVNYWLRKFERNVQRDDTVTDQLRERGWTVLRFWESDVKSNLKATAHSIAEIVNKKRAQRKS